MCKTNEIMFSDKRLIVRNKLLLVFKQVDHYEKQNVECFLDKKEGLENNSPTVLKTIPFLCKTNA